jgi:hypothetical protein
MAASFADSLRAAIRTGNAGAVSAILAAPEVRRHDQTYIGRERWGVPTYQVFEFILNASPGAVPKYDVVRLLAIWSWRRSGLDEELAEVLAEWTHFSQADIVLARGIIRGLTDDGLSEAEAQRVRRRLASLVVDTTAKYPPAARPQD